MFVRMKTFLPWQIVFGFGLMLIVVKLLLELLIPLGVILIIISLIMFFTQQPKVVKSKE